MTEMNATPDTKLFSNLSGSSSFMLRGAVRPDFLKNETLGEIFRATAQSKPDNTAIIEEDRRWTYGEADAASDNIARALAARGISAGDVVGLFFPRGADLLLAQIAIAKLGATWLPFDYETPKDRIVTCLADAKAKGLLVNAVAGKKLGDFSLPTWSVSDAEFQSISTVALPDPRKEGHGPDSFAYMIYTSGSTGVPKGIAITNRNICHYLRSCNSIFGITEKDVVFQGCSAAFDLSMEEIWVPYLVGAILWVATPDILADVENLPAAMRDAGITVIDTVPTLLSLFGSDVPSLRLVIVGGEACPPGIVERFTKNGCRLFNSYGPTEATVVATIAEMKAGEPVTIGGPIPNYTAYVVDEALNPVTQGQQGELLLGGPGIAPGYLERPELTAQKFIANPFFKDAADTLLYRSGDAVTIDAQGRIVFQGRIDDQVKIRGFRVELGEIETAIAEQHGVEHVAVVLRGETGVDRLVAFVTALEGEDLHIAELREALKKRLPPYMVPAAFEVFETLPRLSSGKIDRKTLRTIQLSSVVAAASEIDHGSNPLEELLIEKAKEIFPGQPIRLDDDFFTDMGGHSLLAAQFISKVRKDPMGSFITLQDMYDARTLRGVAALQVARGALEKTHAEVTKRVHAPLSRRFWCGLGQAAVMPIILALSTGQWLSVYLTYFFVTPDDASLALEVSVIVALLAGMQLFNIMLVLAVKWLVIGRTKPGRYPLWGSYYFRVWLVQRFSALAHEKWLQGTVFYRIFLRLLGAKVGSGSIIGQASFECHDLITIGTNASIGNRVILAASRVEGDEFIIGPVVIGNSVSIGGSSVVESDTRIGDDSEIGDLTVISSGTTVGPLERWVGSPGRCVEKIDPRTLPVPPQATRVRKFFVNLAYLAGVILIPPMSLIPIIPAFYVVDTLDAYISKFVEINYLYYIPLLAWPAAMLSILLTMGLAVALRWVVLPRRVSSGTFSVHSWFYVRKWALSLADDVVNEVLGSIYATIYMRAWYRLLGMKIGKGSEISTSFSGRYDLVEIGDNCFVADLCNLGEEEISHGWMTMGKVKVGNQVFIGNGAIVPMNTTVPDNALIGVQSRSPAGYEMKSGDTWFGSPAIKLPVRQKFQAAGEHWTFEPTRWMRIRRAIVEALNASFPTMLMISFGSIAIGFLSPYVDDLDEHVWPILFFFIGMSTVISFLMMFASVAQKWLFMGVYKPTINPMWSWWALRTEAVAVTYGTLAGEILFEHLRGTPMLPWLLRLFGVKIGKGVFMDATDITEFDCVEIGDFSAVNAGACLQTHLYEDRLMKVGRIRIAEGVTVGAGSTVLYDTRVGDNVVLGPVTLVMKGEELPANSSWIGSPAQPAAIQMPASPAVVKAEPLPAAA